MKFCLLQNDSADKSRPPKQLMGVNKIGFEGSSWFWSLSTPYPWKPSSSLLASVSSNKLWAELKYCSKMCKISYCQVGWPKCWQHVCFVVCFICYWRLLCEAWIRIQESGETLNPTHSPFLHTQNVIQAARPWNPLRVCTCQGTKLINVLTR